MVALRLLAKLFVLLMLIRRLRLLRLLRFVLRKRSFFPLHTFLQTLYRFQSGKQCTCQAFGRQVLQVPYRRISLAQHKLVNRLQQQAVAAAEENQGVKAAAVEEAAEGLVYLADSKILRLKLIARLNKERKHSEYKMLCCR